MPTVEVTDLTKTFTTGQDEVVYAVDNLSFSVDEGELFTLLGPSGCGKTTTLRCLAGFERINGGEIKLKDQMVSNPGQNVSTPPEKRDVGFVFQSYGLWPHMTTRENIMYALKGRDYPKEKRVQRIREVLELVDLPEMEDRYASELSGGQQQRVAVARAISYEPDLLLMDEPLSNLDLQRRKDMRQMLVDILDEVGMTTVYVTHDQEEAFEISDKVAVLNRGEKIQEGTPFELYRKPKTAFVASFIGEANILDVDVPDLETVNGRTTCTLDDGERTWELTCTLPDIRPQNPKLVIRSEDIKTQPPASDEVNDISGTVVKTLYRGGTTQNIVELGNIELQVNTPGDGLREGEEVELYLPYESSLLVSG